MAETYTRERFPKVAGRCPSCGRETLFLGAGGYVTCSLIGCPNPTAVNDRLLAERGQGGEEAGVTSMGGISPENVEAMRLDLPEVGALVCPRCGGGDCFSGPPGCTSLALTVEDVLELLRRYGAGRCHWCGDALEPAHPSVRERQREHCDSPREARDAR